MISSKTLLVLIVAVVQLAFDAADAQVTQPPQFRAETIDSKVIIGYGVAIGDVNGDRKPDILLADKKQFCWYENPDWTRHVIAENLTVRDNVCIAARDIDGDGRVEVAVGGQWNPGDTVNSGSVHYLRAPDDRTRPWTPVKLHHEPVVHRMRWLKLGERDFVLVVAPLHGRGNRGGQGKGVRLLAYHPPTEAEGEWKTELLDDTMHVTHNFDVGQWNPATESEELLWYGREGAKLISFDAGRWQSRLISGVQGGGEIRMGKWQPGSRFLTTIEPFHGSELVRYQPEPQRPSAAGTAPTSPPAAPGYRRTVMDRDFNQGHAIATADFMGSGMDQVVAGWRNPNSAGKVGVKFYFPMDPSGNRT